MEANVDAGIRQHTTRQMDCEYLLCTGREEASPSGHNSFQIAAKMQRYLVTRFKVNDVVKILGMLRKLLSNIKKTGRQEKHFHLEGESDRKMEKKYTIRNLIICTLHALL
jgi:hypothetical protein